MQSGGRAQSLTANLIVSVAKVHLKGVVLYQQELAKALTAANRQGEESQRLERLSIWGPGSMT